jgi:SAM-dependent methyltransferase
VQADRNHVSNGDHRHWHDSQAGLPASQVEMVFRLKHGTPPRRWWTGPGMRRRFGFFTPDDYYEALVAHLVKPETAWLDVGSGRHVFPDNPPLARLLAARCCRLVGVDPSPNIEENPFVHERVRCKVEEYRPRGLFDLATLRMMAEHVTQPDAAVAALARMLRPGGKVVVLTVNSLSPVALLARLLPFQLHHRIKRLFWRTEERDSFPVAYQMNTRSQLNRLFAQAGFREHSFAYLDDCRIFHRFRLLSMMETSSWKALRAVGVPYPEQCLLAVYERHSDLPRW